MILLFIAMAQADLYRESRLAMGTLVGITLNSKRLPEQVQATMDAAYAEIERWEALLSEWRPQSHSSRMNQGERVDFPAEADALFNLTQRLQLLSEGAFSLTWRGGSLRQEGDFWWVEGGKVDLGSCLKGFLVDQAIRSLEESGEENFLVDAAGDVGARGSAPGQKGWAVSIDFVSWKASIQLLDASLSSASQDQQPGHIRDARTGEEARKLLSVSVVAPTGLEADALDTAIFAAGKPIPWPGSRQLWEQEGQSRLGGDRPSFRIRRALRAGPG